jgi:hypothetical protein
MKPLPPLYVQALTYVRQYSQASDLRHQKALCWMVYGLLCSQKLSLPTWEPYVWSRATQAQSYERRWQRWLKNERIDVERLYLPLVMAALSQWSGKRLYLALDTTVLWDKYCMIHLSVVCCGRAIPLLWKVIEHESATVGFPVYRDLLRKARWLLRHQEVMLLADRAFACHDLMAWLHQSPWHYALRLKSDVPIQGVCPTPVPVSRLVPPLNEASIYRQVRLWTDGAHVTNLIVATARGAKEPWTVITNETPTLNTLWQYGLRFRIEELFLDSKSGAFQLAQSDVRSTEGLERLYLVAALALLMATTQGMAVQFAGLRSQVDPHWRRGLSYLKIGLRYLQGVIHKGRPLLQPKPLLAIDPEPCFASRTAHFLYYNTFWFQHIRQIDCKTLL